MGKKKKEKSKQYILHSFKDNWIVAHPEIIVGAPDFNLFLNVARVRNGEFCSKSVNVVKVTVGLVLMLLLKFIGIETLVIETKAFLGRSRSRPWEEGSSNYGLCGSSSLSSGLEMERTASSGSLLGNSTCVPFLSSGCEVVCHASGGSSCRSMGTHLDGSTRRRKYVIFLVHFVYICICCDAGIAGDNFLRADVESRAHDGTFRCTFCEN